MISTNIPDPQANFWEEIMIKVQQIEKRANQPAPPPKISREQSIRKKKFSRFEVEEAWHRSQQEATALANRIKYLEVEQQRQNHSLTLAKQKYQRMMAARERSLRQKDELSKKISENNQEKSKELEQKVSKVKEERFRVTQSVQKVRAKNETHAKEIRQFTAETEKSLRLEREMEIEQKKNKVESVRESVERSRMRLGQLHEDRVRLGKVEHKESIKKQLTINLHQHRRNSLLRQKLQESIISAQNNKQETLGLLKEYLTLMTPSLKGRANSESQRGSPYARPISLTFIY